MSLNRKFDGKLFMLVGQFITKQQAINEGRNIKKRDSRARIRIEPAPKSVKKQGYNWLIYQNKESLYTGVAGFLSR